MKEENKRIAKNTVVVYIRLILTTILGIVSSRFVLQELGVSNYGLYNVVGAVIIMLSFVSTTLSSTSIRFINFEQGKEDGDVNRVFNICFLLHIIFALVTFVLLETIGVVYIHHYLNVEPGKEWVAMFIFQISTIVAVIGVASAPFQSLLVVYEKFSVIAIIDIVFSVLRFLVVCLLLFYKGDTLRVYAISMAVVSIVNTGVIILYSSAKWPDVVKFRLIRERHQYKEMFVYNNYNLLSITALLVRNQGSNVLINYFFGTVVNAAYAIAFSIQNYIITFVGNFDSASSPQITQNIGKGNRERSFFLAKTTCRICFLLTELILFPVFCELDFILHLWLGDNVPQGTTDFCICTLLVALISSTSGGLVQLINAAGKLKWFTLQYTMLYMLSLVVGFVLFKNGFPAYTIILLYFIADLISRINQLYLLKHLLSFDVASFVKGAYVRPMVVLLCGVGYLIIRNYLVTDSLYFHYGDFIISLVFTAGMICIFGLYKNERNMVYSFVKNRIKK